MPRYMLGDRSIELQRGDITQAETDAIANAASAMLMGGGGVDGAIHQAAGPELMEALREIKRTLPGGLLATGQAVATPGFALRAKWVIHCVGPMYSRERDNAAVLLASCYESAVQLCRQKGIRSITFPSISTGVYGYPIAEAAPVALRAVRRAMQSGPSECHFMLFDDQTLDTYCAAADKVLIEELESSA